MIEDSYISEVLALPLEEALPEAQRLRQDVHGKAMRRIQPVNGYLLNERCGGDCQFCGWNRSVDPAGDGQSRDKLTPERLREEVKNALSVGAGLEIINNTVRMTSRLLAELERLSWVCDEIPTGLNIGLVHDPQQFQALKEMGYVYYVNDLETAPRIYQELVGTHQWGEKIVAMRKCLETGLDLHSGLILGLGEKDEDLAVLMKTFDQLKVSAVVVNFFSVVNGVSIPGMNYKLSPQDCLRRLSQIRIMFPKAQLILGGGRRSWLGEDLIRESFLVVDSLYVRAFLNHSDPYWLRESEVIASMGLD